MAKIEILCVSFCFLCSLVHFIAELILSYKQNKRIKELCSMCGFPVYDGEKHNCKLTSEQLNSLYNFVVSVRGSDDGSKR